jgi:hypothetical protein
MTMRLIFCKTTLGVLHSDKYGAYVRLAEQKVITWCPCYGHIRRKLFEAEEAFELFLVLHFGEVFREDVESL